MLAVNRYDGVEFLKEGDKTLTKDEDHDYELTHVHLLRAYERLRDDVVVLTKKIVRAVFCFLGGAVKGVHTTAPCALRTDSGPMNHAPCLSLFTRVA